MSPLLQPSCLERLGMYCFLLRSQGAVWLPGATAIWFSCGKEGAPVCRACSGEKKGCPVYRPVRKGSCFHWRRNIRDCGCTDATSWNLVSCFPRAWPMCFLERRVPLGAVLASCLHRLLVTVTPARSCQRPCLILPSALLWGFVFSCLVFWPFW